MRRLTLGKSPRGPRSISAALRPSRFCVSSLLGDDRSRGRASGPHKAAGVAGEDLRFEGKGARRQHRDLGVGSCCDAVDIGPDGSTKAMKTGKAYFYSALDFRYVDVTARCFRRRALLGAKVPSPSGVPRLGPSGHDPSRALTR